MLSFREIETNFRDVNNQFMGRFIHIQGKIRELYSPNLSNFPAQNNSLHNHRVNLFASQAKYVNLL